MMNNSQVHVAVIAPTNKHKHACLPFLRTHAQVGRRCTHKVAHTLTRSEFIFTKYALSQVLQLELHAGSAAHWRLGPWNFTTCYSEWKLSELIRLNFSSKTYLMVFKFCRWKWEWKAGERVDWVRRTRGCLAVGRNALCWMDKTLNAHGQIIFLKNAVSY